MADRPLIPYTKHAISWEDEMAVYRVLKSDRLTQGPEVEAFEAAFAEKVGAKYCVAVSSGTAALHLAYLACGVGPGKTVLTTPISFLATANAVLHCGAAVRFGDTHPQNGMLAEGLHGWTYTVPVSLGGQYLWCERIGDAKIIYDFCHGPYEVPPDMDTVCYSFHASKIIAAGEGGAVVTNDHGIYFRVLSLRDHGRRVTNEPSWPAGASVMYELGFNYRMPEMSAALARSQLTRLDWSIRERRRIAKVYDEAFLDHPQIEVIQGPDSVYHLYQILVNNRDAVRQNLAARGIGTQVHYRPIHLEPYYREQYGFRPGDFPNAERFAARTLSLPMFPTLTDGEVNHVIQSVLACVTTTP